MRLIDYFDRGAALYPNEACLIEGEAALSYAEVAARTHAIALAIRAAGYAPGAKAGIYAPNSARLLECLLGVLRAGLVWAPLNARATTDELAHVVNLVACDVIFYDAKFASSVELLRARCPSVTRFICISDEGEAPFAAFLAQHEGRFPELPDDPTAIAAIFTTGGTTGLPKGVVDEPCVRDDGGEFFAAFPSRSRPGIWPPRL